MSKITNVLSDSWSYFVTVFDGDHKNDEASFVTKENE